MMGKEYYPAVELSINGQNFHLYVDDEYEDFRKDIPLLSFCLVLRELENYQSQKSYSDWCLECELDATHPQVKKYYTNLESTYNKIKEILGEIDSRISDYDFGLNAGAAQELRKANIS